MYMLTIEFLLLGCIENEPNITLVALGIFPLSMLFYCTLHNDVIVKKAKPVKYVWIYNWLSDKILYIKCLCKCEKGKPCDVDFKEYNLVAIALPYIYLKTRFLHYTIQQREPYIFISSPSLPHKKLVEVKVWFIIKLKLISEFVLSDSTRENTLHTSSFNP